MIADESRYHGTLNALVTLISRRAELGAGDSEIAIRRTLK